MQGNREKIAGIILLTVLSFTRVTAQISPGELSSFHSDLEGISNCTRCHVLGNKVSSEKCLACHTEIQTRVQTNKGYHSSSEVRGKECVVCHNDHHGKNFQIIRFDIEKFDHSLTGYALSVPHGKKKCIDCHNNKNIGDQKIAAKKFTFLGVGTGCLSCHEDYHQKTLPPTCLSCHSEESFKSVTNFNHSRTKYPLVGKHSSVTCLKCHKVEIVEGRKLQKFQGIPFGNCNNCHIDPHQNKFGQNCSQCHSEESFKSVKVSKNFDHNKTSFRLEDKHLGVSCQSCHKTKFTDPLKHDRCKDCHTDYHKKQFVKNGISPDCSQCHTVKGFTLFSYTIEQHKQGAFPLDGAHEAIPCIDCHRKQKDWSFRGVGINCRDCHKDIHQSIIPVKYYATSGCKSCHNTKIWSDVTFDHSKTGYILTGAHIKESCRACHFTKDEKGNGQQKFSGLPESCTACHKDNHNKQFEKNGSTDCTECHDTDNWKASEFDHNKTTFKLDGKHVNVQCNKCHKPQQEGSLLYIKYKLRIFTCESCHS